jgi:pimeloyl-ACP methyl ester carboxylesterase
MADPRVLVVAVLVASLIPICANGQDSSVRSPESTWVQGADYRLHANVFTGDKVSEQPVLLVVLHGDQPRNPSCPTKECGEPDYQDAFAAKGAAGRDVIAVGLLRPGYTDPRGNTSDGVRGETTGDNYNTRNTDAIAAAIVELKRRYHSRQVVIAGHSGGAAIAANILARHSNLIDAALLVSCPCDVEKWREHMFQRTQYSGFLRPVDTLSPIDLIDGLSKQVAVTMMVGSEDTIAPPSLSESYQAKAVKLGKRVRLVRVDGKEHDIFLDAAVFAELARVLK